MSQVNGLTDANLEAHDFRLDFAADVLRSFKREPKTTGAMEVLPPLSPMKCIAAIPGLRNIEKEYVIRWATESRKRMFAVMENSKIVSLALLHLVDFNPLHPGRAAPWVIDFIVSHPDYKRRGFARTLIEEMKVHTSDLVAMPCNTASDELFGNAAFVESGYMTFSWNDGK